MTFWDKVVKHHTEWNNNIKEQNKKKDMSDNYDTIARAVRAVGKVSWSVVHAVSTKPWQSKLIRMSGDKTFLGRIKYIVYRFYITKIKHRNIYS